MAGGKLSAGATIVQVVFIIFNILFSIVGALVLALGIYLFVEGQNYSFVTNVGSGAGLLVASGVITFCIAAVGFVGACFKLRPLLGIFAAVLILIVLLEIAAAIVGVVHRSRVTTTLQDEYTNAWLTAISEYNTNADSPDYMEDVNNAVDALQSGLECCGANAPNDWGLNNPQALYNLSDMLPDSCSCTIEPDVVNCSTVRFEYTVVVDGSNVTRIINQTAWDVGCVNATIDATRRLFVVAIGTGFVIGIIEIFGIIISLGLICCITSSVKKELV